MDGGAEGRIEEVEEELYRVVSDCWNVAGAGLGKDDSHSCKSPARRGSAKAGG